MAEPPAELIIFDIQKYIPKTSLINNKFVYHEEGIKTAYPETNMGVSPNNLYGFRYSRAHDIAVLRLQLEAGDIMWLNDITLPESSFGISGT